jgi:hypothetical protein
VIGSCGKIVEEFGEVLKMKDCLRKIIKLLQFFFFRLEKRSLSTPGLDVAITDSKYKRKVNGRRGTRLPIAQDLQSVHGLSTDWITFCNLRNRAMTKRSSLPGKGQGRGR